MQKPNYSQFRLYNAQRLFAHQTGFQLFDVWIY